MRTISIYILYNRNRADELNIVKQTVKTINTAAQLAGVNVEIEVTNHNVKLERVTFDNSRTPVVIIDDSVEFTSNVPPVDLIRRKLDSLNRMPVSRLPRNTEEWTVF